MTIKFGFSCLYLFWHRQVSVRVMKGGLTRKHAKAENMKAEQSFENNWSDASPNLASLVLLLLKKRQETHHYVVG